MIFVLFLSILLVIFLLYYLFSKNIYVNKSLYTKHIDRELLYLEYSVTGGNSPFNNFKKYDEITLLSNKRLRNIRSIIEEIIENNIAGDILEAGNWRGGSMLYAKGVLEAYEIRNKKIWMFDTFCGFPKSTIARDGKEKELIKPGRIVDMMKSNSIEKVKSLFDVYNLRFGINYVSGVFSDTIPNINIPKLSYIRLDADSYDNTKFLLEKLYNKLIRNGYIEFDDYGSYPGCRKAVDEFRKNNNIKSEMKYVYENVVNYNYEAVYWKKTEKYNSEILAN